MAFGFWGKILVVNLTERTYGVQERDENFFRTYLGGRGLIAHYLMHDLRAHTDALAPENVLVFAPSVLTGSPIPGAARHSVGAKSPLTGAFGEGEAGGFWGEELKKAGWDGIVVTGRAEAPTYLLIQDGQIEFRDARHLWRKATLEVQNRIREENSDKHMRVAQIGPAGERLIRFANIANDLHDFIGRTGLGAVMGSKNLKAVAVRGTRQVPLAHRDDVLELAKWARDNYKATLGTMQEMGTARGLVPLSLAGGLPTHNFTEGSFARAEGLSGRTMTDTILVDRESCYACPVHCKRAVEFEEPYGVRREYGGPEYETLAAFGSNLCIDDLKAVAKANEICNANGLDTMSAGMMIAYAMECAEQGLLPGKYVDGCTPRFGDANSMLTLLQQIVERQGLGDVLAEGPRAAAAELGAASEKYALHVKNQPLALHCPRFKRGLGLGYAISPTGPDHMHNLHDTAYNSAKIPSFGWARELGILEPLPESDLSPAKARLAAYMIIAKSAGNVLDLCAFLPYGLEQYAGCVRAVTGWDLTVWEMMKASERALNLARAFNAREGFTRQDDTLPARFFEEPLKNGPLAGATIDRHEFETARLVLYDILGWDRESAAPTPGKLYELGLDWVVPELGGVL
jgi:aldehyde:ferredoxin oxidoreductase